MFACRQAQENRDERAHDAARLVGAPALCVAGLQVDPAARAHQAVDSAAPHTFGDTGPIYGHDAVGPLDNDLTRNGRQWRAAGRAHRRDGARARRGRPAGAQHPDRIWQANAAGRYIEVNDQHDAPLDPNFFGGGRCVTDDDGVYRFTTVRPGAYPWGNHPNAWRPSHIHLSLFGACIASRLITQMFFPGDPLLALRSDFPGHARGSARPADRAVFPRCHRGSLCAGLRLRRRAARAKETPMER
jgi:protocatechuate 3,4-dioxygenase beta subunit